MSLPPEVLSLLGRLADPAVLLALLVTEALVVVLLTALLNAVALPRLRAPAAGARPGTRARPDAAEPAAVPRISVCIPARDEAGVIGGTVAALVAQDPAPHEVLVLDDGSSDGTAETAHAAGEETAAAVRAAGRAAPAVRVLAGEPLPAGWAGKPWACRQLADAATGDHLLFTDADTAWRPGALAAVAAEAARTRADLLTAWPTQETVSLAERLTVPLMAFTVVGYLPMPAVHRTPFRVFTAAVGQCLYFRREAYDAIGGHAAVARSVLDDMALARRIRGAGLRLRVADAAGLIACRMYRDWPSVRDGFAKNILAGYGSLPGLALGTWFHWTVLLGPWAWLLLGWALPAGRGGLDDTWPWWPAVLAALGIAARAVTAAITRQRVRDALLLPVSALVMTAVAVRAAAWSGSGGPRWKGRVVPSGSGR